MGQRLYLSYSQPIPPLNYSQPIPPLNYSQPIPPLNYSQPIPPLNYSQPSPFNPDPCYPLQPQILLPYRSLSLQPSLSQFPRLLLLNPRPALPPDPSPFNPDDPCLPPSNPRSPASPSTPDPCSPQPQILLLRFNPRSALSVLHLLSTPTPQRHPCSYPRILASLQLQIPASPSTPGSLPPPFSPNPCSPSTPDPCHPPVTPSPSGFPSDSRSLASAFNPQSLFSLKPQDPCSPFNPKIRSLSTQNCLLPLQPQDLLSYHRHNPLTISLPPFNPILPPYPPDPALPFNPRPCLPQPQDPPYRNPASFNPDPDFFNPTTLLSFTHRTLLPSHPQNPCSTFTP
ncbi:uncharacterized protein [Salvelinus sp. IW2-2015]|uniref:uncharacterized protein n=1 Tax=Salvelinus sp. IW2-2015 TaxID=2691554 RepID=UPI0038D46ADA